MGGIYYKPWCMGQIVVLGSFCLYIKLLNIDLGLYKNQCIPTDLYCLLYLQGQIGVATMVNDVQTLWCKIAR